MTGEQERLDWSQLIETALTAEGKIGNTYNRFYNYSFTNQMFLMMQGVREPVATYKRWQDVGRQVVKGSVAKAIIRPITVIKKNEAGEIQDAYRRFKAVRCIFSLSDTEGPELPPVELPKWDLKRALEVLDIKQVPFDSLNGNMQGFSTGREFAINPVAVNPPKTMFHEVGHIVLGHTAPEAFADYVAHRGVKEFQAEATAYLTMHELDQLPEEDAIKSRGYLQHWLRGQRPPDAAIRQVFTATDTILKAGRVEIEAVE